MGNAFIVVANERGYCEDHWIIGVFSTPEKAWECRDGAQQCADDVHKKIRALGEEDGIIADWRTVCLPKTWDDDHAEYSTDERFAALKELKRQANPYDPDMEVGWECTMRYEIQEWSVDTRDVVGHRRTRF